MFYWVERASMGETQLCLGKSGPLWGHGLPSFDYSSHTLRAQAGAEPGIGRCAYWWRRLAQRHAECKNKSAGRILAAVSNGPSNADVDGIHEIEATTSNTYAASKAELYRLKKVIQDAQSSMRSLKTSERYTCQNSTANIHNRRAGAPNSKRRS